MNEEIRIFGFAAGFMCLLLSPIGLITCNYVYFFKPEQHGQSPEISILILNGLCIFSGLAGWKLMKKCSKPH